MIKRNIFGLVILTISSLYADNPYASPPPTTEPTPWLTGPLIVFPGTVYPKGHFAVETYVYTNIFTGTYDEDWNRLDAPNFYQVNPQVFALVGITPKMDIHAVPNFFYNRTQGVDATRFADLPVGLDYQLVPADGPVWKPGVKLTLREIFPTGQYQNLNPGKLLTDSSGMGSYGTLFNALLYKVYHFTGHHFLSATLSAGYTVFTKTHVEGFNTYGGGYGTHGKVSPGSTFQAIASFEYALTQRWVLVWENVYLHTNKTTFHGFPGFVTQCTPSDGLATVGFPSEEQISFAPEIEYNFSSNFGIIAGFWFTAWGRNTSEFRSGVINFVYNY